MSGRLTSTQLEPLLQVARRFEAQHVSVFGSATSRPLADVGDIDLHVIVPRLKRSVYEAFVTAAQDTIEVLAAEAGCEWHVELRHGPLKPPPDKARVLQLHLLLDNNVSLRQLPNVLLAHRAMTGKLLHGEHLPLRAANRRGLATQFREAEDTLAAARDALLARQITFRHWIFSPRPSLVEGRLEAAAAWEMNCLLRGVATTADLHYFATVLTQPTALTSSSDTTRRLLTQIRDLPADWRELAERWQPVRDQALAILDQRINDLAQRRAVHRPS